MLSKLSIQNYAIIDRLEINFSLNLNVITGETGAGKSIIAGALGLILGDRADTGVLVNKEQKSVIEGSFQIKGKDAIRDFLDENDFDKQDELLIRREIAANGKTRAFINDTPVTLSQLNLLSSLLVDLHRQFDTLEIGQADFQRDVLDALASHGALLANYREKFLQWQEFSNKLSKLKEQKQQFDREFDYNQFQFTELEEAAFEENEIEQLEVEQKMHGHSEEIKTALEKVYYELQESERPIVQELKKLVNQLQHFSSFHPELPSLIQRIQSSQIELQDVADETNRMSSHVNFDPARLGKIQERLSIGYKLLKKHNVKNTNELIEVRRQLQQKLQEVLEIDDQIKHFGKIISGLEEELNKDASKISEGRKKQVKPFEEKVNSLLVQVGMPGAKLKVAMSAIEPGIKGIDRIEFLFDANKSGQYKPVNKVASGGELSRLMLCIKSLVAESLDLPTLVFDEIDTGISGEAARQIGIILKNLSDKRQVICITHQPQIAGKANAHFFVYKEIVLDAVKTSIRPLSHEERIIIIAKMLSGERPTAAAMENAREMVGN